MVLISNKKAPSIQIAGVPAKDIVNSVQAATFTYQPDELPSLLSYRDRCKLKITAYLFYYD